MPGTPFLTVHLQEAEGPSSPCPSLCLLLSQWGEGCCWEAVLGTASQFQCWWSSSWTCTYLVGVAVSLAQVCPHLDIHTPDGSSPDSVAQPLAGPLQADQGRPGLWAAGTQLGGLCPVGWAQVAGSDFSREAGSPHFFIKRFLGSKSRSA